MEGLGQDNLALLRALVFLRVAHAVRKLDVLAKGFQSEVVLGRNWAQDLLQVLLKLADRLGKRDPVIDDGSDNLGLRVRAVHSGHAIAELTKALILTPPLIMSTAWVVLTMALPMPGIMAPSSTLPLTHQSSTSFNAFLSTLLFL